MTALIYTSLTNLIQNLRDQISESSASNPLLSGWGSFSQFDEDGIIRECLTRISRKIPLSKTFIEIGCGKGLENNTHQLLLDGYSGVWVDGDPNNIAFINHELNGLRFNRLLVMEKLVTLKNLNELINESLRFLKEQDIDFFSCDVDGNDLYFVQSTLKIIKPKLICVEYNAKFFPPTNLVIDYNEKHSWLGDDYFSASLQSWVDMLKEYTLVCCNLSGVNAFFIRNDLMQNEEVIPIDKLYQPARYFLIEQSTSNGHPASMKWLRQTLSLTI